MFAFSLSQIIPLLFCVWCVQFVFWIFFLKKYFTPCFWRVPCVSEFFPKISDPVLMCLTCLMCFVCLVWFFCVSCVFLSSLFFLFSKIFTPRNKYLRPTSGLKKRKVLKYRTLSEFRNVSLYDSALPSAETKLCCNSLMYDKRKSSSKYTRVLARNTFTPSSFGYILYPSSGLPIGCFSRFFFYFFKKFSNIFLATSFV